MAYLGMSSVPGSVTLKPTGEVMTPLRPLGKKPPMPLGLPTVRMLMCWCGTRQRVSPTPGRHAWSSAPPCRRQLPQRMSHRAGPLVQRHAAHHLGRAREGEAADVGRDHVGELVRHRDVARVGLHQALVVQLRAGRAISVSILRKHTDGHAGLSSEHMRCMHIPHLEAHAQEASPVQALILASHAGRHAQDPVLHRL